MTTNWRTRIDEPLGLLQLDELLHILQALALTNCDPRTLAVVARATGLGEWWREVEVGRAVYLLAEVER